MIGRWTRKIIDFLCVSKVSNYTLALVFGILFSLIGFIAASIEFGNIIFVDVSGNNPLEFFEPLLNKLGSATIILVFIMYFSLVIFVFLLNIYIFFWFGVNFGNLIGWVQLKEVPWREGERKGKFLDRKNVFSIFNMLVFIFVFSILIHGILISFVWEGKKLPLHNGINLAFVREEGKEKIIYCYLSDEKRLKRIYRITPKKDFITPKKDFIELRWLLFEDKLFLKQFYYTRVGMYTKVRKVGVIDCRSGKVMGVGDVIGKANLERVMDALNVKNENKMWERCKLVNIGKKYNYFLYDLDNSTSTWKGTLLIERRSDGELIKVKDVSYYYLDISPDERYIVYGLRGEDYRNKGEIYLFDIEKREKIFLCKGKYPFFYRDSQVIVYRYNRDEDIFRGELRKYDLSKKKFSAFINPSTHKPYPGDLLDSESVIVSDRECLYMLVDSLYGFTKNAIVELNLSKSEYKILVSNILSCTVGRSGR